MRFFQSVIFIFLTLTSVSFIKSYRILCVFPFNGHSHNIMFTPIKKGLIERGHQVDDITHFPLKNPPPNYNVVVNLSGTMENLVNTYTINYTQTIQEAITYALATRYGNKICELLSSDVMQKFIRNPPSNTSYDLVITEAFGAHCFMGFGNFFKVPVVAISTALEYPWITHFIGNNDNMAFVPNVLTTDFDKFKFWDRLKNVFGYYWSVYQFHLLTTDVQTMYMRKYLSPNIPNIREVERSVALTLVNSHPIFGIKPITASLIQVGGLHIEENEILPPNLKKWLDASRHGFIYFSLGSLTIIDTLPTDTLKSLYECFEKLAPATVLVKIVNTQNLPPGLPKNVYTSSWIPQLAVLAHSNIKGFMTHGGLMSTQEAIYYGVPLIGIPLYGDQEQNIEKLVEKNMAIKIYLNNLTYTSVNYALNEILTNPKYRENAKYYSRFFRDNPITPKNASIYWIEYVIRNGPKALRSPALDLYWWQLILLDVFIFVFLCLSVVLILMYYCIKIFFQKILLLKKIKNE